MTQVATYRRDVEERRVSPRSLRLARIAVEGKRAMQKPVELAGFLDYLAGVSPLRNVLEIGGMRGGSTWLWGRVAERGRPPVVVVDQFVLDGRLEHAGDAQHVLGDSHAPETRDEVVGLFDGRTVDLLFIDGDHSYAGTRQDFWTYSPLVRPGGIVALHDTVVPHVDVHQHYVIPFWLEVCTQFDHLEFFDPSEDWGGIGVLVMP
jgi:predicted O-methyltransferase YrrM